LDLFDPYVGRYVSMTDTGCAAFHKYYNSAREAAMARKILRVIAARGSDGATCKDLEREIGAKHETISGQLVGMENQRLVARFKDKKRLDPDTSTEVYIYYLNPTGQQSKVPSPIIKKNARQLRRVLQEFPYVPWETAAEWMEWRFSPEYYYEVLEFMKE
jgi:hypothetical protein